MAYDYKTKSYIFDFDSVTFPIKVSDNVLNYLFPNHDGDSPHTVSKEQIKAILRGDDRSQTACMILGNLLHVYNGHRELPPEEFDIISDTVVKSEKTKEYSGCVEYTDHHEGECVYGSLVFDFAYTIQRTYYSPPQSERYTKSKSTVVLKGHSMENENSYMHEACASYLEKEAAEDEKKRIEIEREKEEKRWDEFIKAHSQDLKDWLIPLVENQYRFHMCDRMKLYVYAGCPGYGLVKRMDMGRCDYCTGRCQFKEHVLQDGEHSREWYELGLDKLGFKYL